MKGEDFTVLFILLWWLALNWAALDWTRPAYIVETCGDGERPRKCDRTVYKWYFCCFTRIQNKLENLYEKSARCRIYIFVYIPNLTNSDEDATIFLPRKRFFNRCFWPKFRNFTCDNFQSHKIAIFCLFSSFSDKLATICPKDLVISWKKTTLMYILVEKPMTLNTL